MNKRLLLLQMLFVAVTVVFSGCSSSDIISKWTQKEIPIDAYTIDWKNNLKYYSGDEIMIGSYNNDKYFYLCFKTSNPETINQVFSMGMVAWLDFDGGKDKNAGIKFPLGMRASKNSREDMMGFRNLDFDKKFEKIKDKLDQIDIVKDGTEDHKTINLKMNPDFSAYLDYNEGVLAYIVKIPLKFDVNGKYAINLDTGKVIGVGLETPDFKKLIESIRKERQSKGERIGEEGPGEGPTSGMFPGGGGMGSEGGMRPGGGMGGLGGRSGGSHRGPESLPDPLKFWVNIKLSTPQTETAK